jgi:hypothetical protein
MSTILSSPLPGFAHRILSNGIPLSTCLLCLKTIGSPTPASLRLAEENHLHLCGSSLRPPEKKQSICVAERGICEQRIELRVRLGYLFAYI